MNRIVLWSSLAALLAVGGTMGANADGLAPAERAAPPAPAAAGCQPMTQLSAGVGATAVPAQSLADAGSVPQTAAAVPGPEDAARQLHERWRQQLVAWFGDAVRDLRIEFRYPEDLENGVAERDDTPRPSGEA